jgi:hypothetical protein
VAARAVPPQTIVGASSFFTFSLIIGHPPFLPLMNPQQPTNEHLIFIRGTHWATGMSPAKLQSVMTDFYAWVEKLDQDGILRGAQPLMEEGKLVTGTKGSTVTDGAFAESKESIAGYFLVAVPTMEEALQIARACPILDHGAQLEVRPIADLCRPMAEVNEALSHH